MLRYLRGRVVAVQDNMGGSSIDRLTTQAGGVDGETLGVTSGAGTHTLFETQMPSHNHKRCRPAAGRLHPTSGSNKQTLFGFGDIRSGSRTSASPLTTNDRGGGQAHNNMQTTIILNYIVKT